MQYRALGDREVSVVGFGGWPMGAQKYGAVVDDESIGAIHAALDAGVNLFDTAAGYGMGHSEQVLARALTGRRDQIVIATKFGIRWHEGQGKYYRDSRRASVREDCEASLRDLDTDYIDIYIHHWPDYETPVEETADVMRELVDEGKVRQLGVSNLPLDRLEAFVAAAPIATDQIGYHQLDRRREADIIPYCREHGIEIMAYGSLAHGLLTGAFTADTMFDDDDWRRPKGRKGGLAFGLPLFAPDHFSKNVAAVARLEPLAAQASVTLPQLAVNWVLREPAVSTALVGFRSASEVASAVEAADAQIPDDIAREVDAITRAAYERMLPEAKSPDDFGPINRSDAPGVA